jgi:succinoglycan biosynthesis transport protein ExoP
MSLQQLLRILLARKWMMLMTVVVTVVVAIIATLLTPPKYTATASIVVDFKTPEPVQGNVFPVALASSYLATQLDILSSHNVALKAVDKLKLADTPEARESFLRATQGEGSIRDWLADFLQDKLKVEPSRQGSMVNVSFRSGDPQFAAAAVNAIVQAYVDTNLEQKVGPAKQTSAFFNEQLQVLKTNLESAQKKLSAAQREKGITATDERFDIENAKLTELSSQVNNAQAQRIDSQSRRNEVNQAIAKGVSPDTLADVLNNPVVQSLKGQLIAAEGRLNAVAGRAGPGHPQYQTALTEVEDLRKKLNDEMRIVARSVNTTSDVASQREGALRGALAAQKARVLEIKKQRDETGILIREVENAQRAYDTANTRQVQTSLESQINQTNIYLLNPATVPVKPSFPIMLLSIALAIIVGGTLAVGLSLIAELLYRTARSEEDLLEVLNVPVLASFSNAVRFRPLRALPLMSRMIGVKPPES